MGQRAIDQWLSELRIQDEPIRSDMLSLDQLQRYAQTLAGWHRVAQRRGGDRLLARFEENARILHQTQRLLSRAAAEGRTSGRRRVVPGQLLLDQRPGPRGPAALAAQVQHGTAAACGGPPTACRGSTTWPWN